MNKNILTILTAMTMALATGGAMAGTWVNGYYVDGPLCTVCDGTRVIAHAYGTTVCTHCDGTGIEPPPETVVVESVIVDTWRPRPLRHHRHPVRRPNPPPRHHVARPARPPHRVARPAPRPAARPAPRPAARPAPRPAGKRSGRR